MLDDLQASLNTVRQLKSRGVTRYYDLRRVNRQQLEDVEEDEQYDDPDKPLHDESDEPPRRRLRLEVSEAPTTTNPVAEPDANEYEPTSPAHSSLAPTSPRAPLLQAHQQHHILHHWRCLRHQ